MESPTPAPPHLRLFASDLDGTLLGNPEATRRFKVAWESLPDERRPLLVYNSGRLVDDMRRLVSDGTLPQGDYYIGGVGTEIYDVRAGAFLSDYTRNLTSQWDRPRIHQLLSTFGALREQPAEFQTELKSSWFFPDARPAQIREIADLLRSQGLASTLVYSSNRDLDFLPCDADKGAALRWLCKRLGLPLSEVLVAGDTGNDASMFHLPDVRGIVVENAKPELFEATVEIPCYVSKYVLADGVLDGLRHFGLFASLPTREAGRLSMGELPEPFQQLFNGTHLRTLSEDEKETLRQAYGHALSALRRTITPLGFAACSLEDNTVTGTDANYRSVWARDGAITIWCTLHLEHPDIRAAQRATFETLLEATTRNGLVPANVRIDTGTPDYCGVGNIASIDSGLWLIIALYNFAAHTGDHSLLYRYAAPLEAIMNWLAAHDSNADGLLEIPEAGDWTDLFGRSYNVLYDEVLWYRANVCYGRILEFMGQFEEATRYLQESQRIRSKILAVFWPSLRHDPQSTPNRFADRQFSLGDTPYLIAEVTPFSFNWRCDVLGNILAFLMHLVDPVHARTTFRFLWGVGVNQPGPVRNLYPVVQAGDPDWKSYYTVNLLNLPHHYHNGGIWPFVGGLWVRYVHRLGFHDVACRELLRLAQLNQQGVNQAWEFNEWYHGETGRPMGKAFQAWSAAAFLRACHDLDAATTDEP